MNFFGPKKRAYFLVPDKMRIRLVVPQIKSEKWYDAEYNADNSLSYSESFN